MIIGRLILRFLLVPLGAIVAVCVAMVVMLLAHWSAFLAVAHADPELQQNYLLAVFLAGPALMVMLSYSVLWMMFPAAIGVLIAETFAIRSSIFHAANGGISAWIGWTAISDIRNQYGFLTDAKVIVAAGLAAGFAYWLVAGWSAGFWKPVFAGPPTPASGPAQA